MREKEAKEKIKRLIDKYNNLSSERIKGYNEAQTRKDFIMPLFEALGWDVRNRKADEVFEEEVTSGKRVDYAFRLDSITKFYLEAKALSVNLDEEKWADQAIWYAWHKSVSWAILTDFESIKVYNAEWDEPRAENSLFFEIKHSEYLKDFDRLWWLSKEGFKKEILDKEALKWGHKPKRVPVDRQLASDLMHWRDLLYNELKGRNPSVNKQKISESVQEVLDRLIFIRTTEDRGIEERTLLGMARTWRDSKKTKAGDLVREINQLFRDYDKNYNSKLFQSLSCEKLDIDDNIYVDIINELYKSKRGIRYNFAAINADVFGSIYEQYLGYIQQKEGTEQYKAIKRKSQGIYYTPRHIVDYIIKNTLGNILKEISAKELKNIKILDPACGSGSFLIRALEELLSYWQGQISKTKKHEKGTHLGRLEETFKMQKGQRGLTTAFKMGLLRDNIFGVDLDREAVEIAQLNLLLKIMERRQLLPNLSHNIICGNSLISGTPIELRKYFGKEWKKKEAFNWSETFTELFKGDNPGFDIIIGNPPYIQSRNLDDKERHYYWDKYLTDTNHSDIYSFFIEKSIDLLKNQGILGFIIPNTWLQTPSFKSLRKKIFTKTKILNILFFEPRTKIFDRAQVSNVVMILQKEINKKMVLNNYISIYKHSINGEVLFSKIRQKEVNFNKGFNIQINPRIKQILDKTQCNSIPLKCTGLIVGGLRTGDDGRFLKKQTDNKYDRKLLRGRDIGRYYLKWAGEYIWYRPDLMKVKQAAAPKEAEIFEIKEKLLIRMISADKIIATYDDESFYLLQDNLLLPMNDYNIKYILSILNSKLASFIVKNSMSNIAITQSLLKNFPIYKIDFSNKKEKFKHNELVKLADKMIELNKKIQKLNPIMDDKEYDEIKLEIEKTDKIINEEVYKLYGLTREEIKIIERL